MNRIKNDILKKLRGLMRNTKFPKLFYVLTAILGLFTLGLILNDNYSEGKLMLIVTIGSLGYSLLLHLAIWNKYRGNN